MTQVRATHQGPRIVYIRAQLCLAMPQWVRYNLRENLLCIYSIVHVNFPHVNLFHFRRYSARSTEDYRIARQAEDHEKIKKIITGFFINQRSTKKIKTLHVKVIQCRALQESTAKSLQEWKTGFFAQGGLAA